MLPPSSAHTHTHTEGKQREKSRETDGYVRLNAVTRLLDPV
jgi:hypothetical protein